MEFDYLQHVFERVAAAVAGRGYPNPNPRTIEELTAALDAKIEKQKQAERRA